MHLQRVTKRFLASTLRTAEIEDTPLPWARVRPEKAEPPEPEWPENVILFRRA